MGWHFGNGKSLLCEGENGVFAGGLSLGDRRDKRVGGLEEPVGRVQDFGYHDGVDRAVRPC